MLDAAFYYTNAVLEKMLGILSSHFKNENLIENLFIVDSTYSLDNIEKQAVNSNGYILDISWIFSAGYGVH